MFKRYLVLSYVFVALLCTTNLVCAKQYLVTQQNKSFVMDKGPIEKLEVNHGDVVEFRNEDPFFHNIFSLSDLKTFDLGSYPKGQSKTVTFSKAGKIEVECAIHPQMFLEITVK